MNKTDSGESMTIAHVDIVGLPYFPGIVTGKLHRGVDGDISDCILLVTHAEIKLLETLPRGLIIIEAAPFSHAMITVLGLGIPTVFINTKQASRLEDISAVSIDGFNGWISTQINEEQSASISIFEHSIEQSAGPAILMADGESVDLSASVRQLSAIQQAVKLGASAIGLVRTEFLIPENEEPPDTEFYQATFRELCEAASPLSVTFRLLDVAADKIPAWLSHSDLLVRPAGLQGVRLYNLKSVANVVDAQVSVLATLASDFNLRILIPYLVRLEEFEYWRDVFRKKIPPKIPIGAMAETPAAVLDIRALLSRADFVAIGCNDLMQNIYAADRDEETLRDYLDPYAPVLFRLLRHAAKQAGDRLQHVQLCGVLPQLQGVLPILLGLGYRAFSIDAPFIPYLANDIMGISRDACERLAEQVCAAQTTMEVLEILHLSTARHVPFFTVEK
jgi:phosphoenolpyruvate-protein kinase (PTS system EI component)